MLGGIWNDVPHSGCLGWFAGNRVLYIPDWSPVFLRRKVCLLELTLFSFMDSTVLRDAEGSC